MPPIYMYIYVAPFVYTNMLAWAIAVWFVCAAFWICLNHVGACCTCMSVWWSIRTSKPAPTGSAVYCCRLLLISWWCTWNAEVDPWIPFIAQLDNGKKWIQNTRPTAWWPTVFPYLPSVPSLRMLPAASLQPPLELEEEVQPGQKSRGPQTSRMGPPGPPVVSSTLTSRWAHRARR